jgi:hypothetical protein
LPTIQVHNFVLDMTIMFTHATSVYPHQNEQ